MEEAALRSAGVTGFPQEGSPLAHARERLSAAIEGAAAAATAAAAAAYPERLKATQAQRLRGALSPLERAHEVLVD